MDKENLKNIIPNFRRQNSSQKADFVYPFTVIRDLQNFGIMAFIPNSG
jgi:hypothetical protein